ncbi:MAG: isochorismatase family protein [Solirubrobacteraceae bacterium]
MQEVHKRGDARRRIGDADPRVERTAGGDIVVRKQRVGAFSTTDLHDQLQARDIDTLLLAGISTGEVIEVGDLHALLH